jgi:hypothetical protein
MAKFELKFLDLQNSGEYIKTNISGSSGNLISISGVCGEKVFEIWLDKSTAIKFAKTLRTEINKITEEEVNNG